MDLQRLQTSHLKLRKNQLFASCFVKIVIYIVFLFKYKLLFSGDTALCRPMSDDISWIYDKDTAQPCGSE